MVRMKTEVVVMSDCDPRINVETCLAELHRELAKLGVTVVAMRDQEGRVCLEVYDLQNRRRRVHVVAQFYWFCWGEKHHERYSVFQIDDAAALLAHLALDEGWPQAEGQGDLSQAFTQFLR